jgi:hypothetical protein
LQSGTGNDFLNCHDFLKARKKTPKISLSVKDVMNFNVLTIILF